ncbi:MAG: hypothetical protein QNJ78_04565 [Gammaproteobacteria bacterium]|nr:hypothetical protein [Gammaproteobacteria bacterium]
MRSQFSVKRETSEYDDSGDRWYAACDDEQFVCAPDKGWYVESREGEFGPFPSLQDAEDFYYSRFRH